MNDMTHVTRVPMKPVVEAGGQRFDQQGRRLCTAHRTDGEPCRGPAMEMQTVCRVHGGAAPQAKTAAQRRIVALVDPSIDALEEALKHGNTSEKLRAIEAILDRAGITRTANLGIAVQTEYSTKSEIYKRLLALREAEAIPVVLDPTESRVD